MIVASMLMSPLLGPILAFSFGTSTRDWHMVRLGIAIELIGLAITFVVGFIAGEQAATHSSFNSTEASREPVAAEAGHSYLRRIGRRP